MLLFRNCDVGINVLRLQLQVFSLHLKNLISEVRIEGLETMDYLDNMKAKDRFTEQGDAIVFESEVGVLRPVKYLMFNVKYVISHSAYL